MFLQIEKFLFTHTKRPQFQLSGSYLDLTKLICISRPCSSAVWFHVDELALVWIMTHDDAKDLHASELGLLWI